MSFNTKCPYLDKAKMKSRTIERKNMDGTEKIIIPTRLCEEKDEWIEDCPEPCVIYENLNK